MDKIDLNLESAKIMAAALGSQDPGVDGGVPYAVVPKDFQIVDLEHLLQSPIATRKTISVSDIASFAAYVSDFKNDATRVFANDSSSPSIMAIIDYSGKDEPHFGQHKCIFTPKLSEEWVRWSNFAKTAHSQGEFAKFLEENGLDIREPAGADLLEITRTLEAKKDCAYRSGVRLSNGSFEIKYSEEVTASAAGGTVQIPEEIKLGIPVFDRGTVYSVTAMFRYRIEEGKLKLSIELHREKYILRDAFDTLCAEAEQKTGLKPLFGTVAEVSLKR